MQLLCKVSTAFSDVSCPVCGQGFLVYWTRQRAGEREEQRDLLQAALREEHRNLEATDIHLPAFQVSETPTRAPQRQPLPIPAPATAIPVYN